MNETATTRRANPGWLPTALDYGPLVLFFVAYKVSGVFVGTATFMAAIVAAVLVSRIRLGRVSPMLWLSAILVVGFGGLTIYFHDERFIQIKPTIIYTLLGGLLLGGFAMGRPLLKYVLEAGYQGLSDKGWMLLSRNWGLFFLTMAVLNEALWRNVSFDTWLTIKVWGISILSFLFGLAHIPLLLKHGLDVGESEAVVPPQG